MYCLHFSECLHYLYVSISTVNTARKRVLAQEDHELTIENAKVKLRALLCEEEQEDVAQGAVSYALCHSVIKASYKFRRSRENCKYLYYTTKEIKKLQCTAEWRNVLLTCN